MEFIQNFRLDSVKLSPREFQILKSNLKLHENHRQSRPKLKEYKEDKDILKLRAGVDKLDNRKTKQLLKDFDIKDRLKK